MSRRTSNADKAIRAAWEKERQLVFECKGTRNWTPEQQQDILVKGKAYDDDGKAFQGHHMMSVEAYPEYQGDAGNIQFLTRAEHILAHNGYTGNPTNGYYDPITGETTLFCDNKYEPCKVIELTEPVMLRRNPEPFEITSDNNADTVTNQSNAHQGNNTSKKIRTLADKPIMNVGEVIVAEKKGLLARVANGVINAREIIFDVGKKAVGYCKENPGKVLLGIAVTALAVNEASKTSKNSSGRKYGDDYSVNFVDDSVYEEADVIDDTVIVQESFITDEPSEKRASPVKHTVSEHKRGETIVASYSRGKEKEE